MLPIILAAAAQLSAFYTVDPRMVFSADDMPAYVQIAGVNRFIVTRTIVGSDGTAKDCVIEGSSGDPKLEALTCAIILKRAKFLPPKWIDGSSAYGVVRTPVTWAIGGPPSPSDFRKAYPADIELQVNKLPAGAPSLTAVQLLIAVDENGKVVGCSEAPKPPFDHLKHYPELVPIACDQMLRTFAAMPPKDVAGRAMRSIQTASVAFTTEH